MPFEDLLTYHARFMWPLKKNSHIKVWIRTLAFSAVTTCLSWHVIVGWTVLLAWYISKNIGLSRIRLPFPWPREAKTSGQENINAYSKGQLSNGSEQAVQPCFNHKLEMSKYLAVFGRIGFKALYVGKNTR